MKIPVLGDFVELRSRPWLVEGVEDRGGGLTALKHVPKGTVVDKPVDR